MSSGYQVWSRQQVEQTLAAVQVAQDALLAHVPTEQARIYQAAQVETLRAIAAGFGLESDPPPGCPEHTENPR